LHALSDAQRPKDPQPKLSPSAQRAQQAPLAHLGSFTQTNKHMFLFNFPTPPHPEFSSGIFGVSNPPILGFTLGVLIRTIHLISEVRDPGYRPTELGRWQSSAEAERCSAGAR
jgi:hypothetical protein